MKPGLAAASTWVAAIVTLAPAVPPDWSEFRHQYPYHIQGIALSKPDGQGWLTLVVAEPPPATTVASLAKVDAVLRDGTVRAHPLGTDGWVKDIVYRVPPMPANQLTGLVDRLSLELFDTSYKAHALPISEAPSVRRPALDFQVSAAQLQEWMTTGKEAFHPLGRGETSSIQQLHAASKSGVFYSTTPGLVAWILPRRGHPADVKRHVRQFALDGDLIIGAVRGATHVAILARERQLPVDALSPLRTETILQLADVGEDELAQSYDRNDYGAGKLEAMKPGLLLRLKIFFSDRVAAPVQRSVEQVVARILGRSPAIRAAAPMNGADIAAAIRADLRALHPELEVEVGIDLGVGDFYVAEASTEALARGRP